MALQKDADTVQNIAETGSPIDAELTRPRSADVPMMLTPEQRFRQARQKARMIGQRQVRQMMAGERDYAECWGDLERQFIIDEIGKAFVAGMRYAVSLHHT